MKGKLKRLFDYKPYGFITGDDGEDYFFHESEIVSGSQEIEITEGQAVEFEAVRNRYDKKGRLCAVQIKLGGVLL